MKIVLLESLGISKELLERYGAALREGGHSFAAYERADDLDTQIQRAEDADILMVANMPVRGELLRACPRLKFIDVAFTGVDHLDLATARELGIAVSNASGYSTESVAELVLGMMLALLRNIPQVEERCRRGETKEGLVGRELRGKTVGIVGYGAIGRRTGELCNAFGAGVVAYNPRRKEGAPGYVAFLPLEELLARADIVTLHCPLSDETRGLIGREQLALMKSTALFINAARGPVVDTRALADALNEGRIAGAAVDVFETEPPLDTAHPLLSARNTIVTPHVAFATEESMELRAEIVFENLWRWMAGEQANKIL